MHLKLDVGATHVARLLDREVALHVLSRRRTTAKRPPLQTDSLVDAVGPEEAERRLVGSLLLRVEAARRVARVLIDVRGDIVDDDDDDLVLVSVVDVKSCLNLKFG